MPIEKSCTSRSCRSFRTKTCSLIVFRVLETKGKNSITRCVFTARDRSRYIEPRLSHYRWQSSLCQRSLSVRHHIICSNFSTPTDRMTSYLDWLQVCNKCIGTFLSPSLPAVPIYLHARRLFCQKVPSRLSCSYIAATALKSIKRL